MHNLQNACQAGFLDEESIETNFETVRLQLRTLERFPTFDIDLDPEGQYAQPSKHF